MTSPIEQEIDENFDIFEALLPDLIEDHAGQFALMRKGKIIGFHRDEMQALAVGRQRFADGIYSIQQVSRRAADLGFFSHAIDTRIAG